jgi:hypothetical protein
MTQNYPFEITLDAGKCSVRDILAINPVPDKLDPFTEALIGGVDPMSAHQALTLAFPILSFLGQHARVLYSDGTLRWISGQSWQMGGSGCGKSLVLRALEELFLSREIREKTENARKAAAYTMLSETERRGIPVPQEKVRIFDSIPTALALLQQAQINDGEAIYLSCSECGEFAKKIANPYYALVLDMMKKSYDGTGAPFMHKTADKTYFVPSMRLCCNVGGTIDPMFRIFRRCDADGTLSRASLTILGERKNDPSEGAYKAPCWSLEQKRLMWTAAERLREFDNRYRECETDVENNPAEVEDGISVAEQDDRLMEERRSRALCVPEIIALGNEIKAHLASYGTEIIDDCCSRADERAMGLAYLLYIANDESAEVLGDIISTVRWWVKIGVDSAYAVQLAINSGTHSYRELVRCNFKAQGINRVQQEVDSARDEAFREYETLYEGEEKSIADFQQIPILRALCPRTVRRLVQDRGYKSVRRGVYVVHSPVTPSLEAA